MSLKELTLRALEEQRETPLSGEQLAQQLGVSRAAVWKTIGQLREEGHRIDAAPNRGYQLAKESDLLTADGVRAALPERWKGLPVTVYRQVDSTNLAARRAALEGVEPPLLFLAEEQTAGRGRLGRSFYSPSRQGVYMSLLLRPELVPTEAVLLTTAASVAVCRALAETAGVEAQIKWVNDVYRDGKKLCGILTEAVTDLESGRLGTVVIGVGVNFRGCQEDFPPELRDTACALFEGQPPIRRNQLAASLASHLLDSWEELRQGDRSYLEEYRRRSLLLGRPIWVIEGNKRIAAMAVDLDGQGGLVVETVAGRRTLSSGEVSIRLQ